MQPSRGFTLIELMIVIAIVGILASIAMPSYRSYVQQATVSQALSMMQAIKTDIMETHAMGGAMPSNSDQFFYDGAADAEIERIHWYSDSNGPRIVADFGPATGSLENKRLWMIMDADSNPAMIQWRCTTHTSSSLAIPNDALPSECR